MYMNEKCYKKKEIRDIFFDLENFGYLKFNNFGNFGEKIN